LKGADSVKNSIDTLQRYELCITKNSANLRREIGKYKWIVDRNGRTLNEPVDFDNHAIDALRYVALNKLRHAGGHIEMR
jgi:phage terminase large subunit